MRAPRAGAGPGFMLRTGHHDHQRFARPGESVAQALREMGGNGAGCRDRIEGQSGGDSRPAASRKLGDQADLPGDRVHDLERSGAPDQDHRDRRGKADDRDYGRHQHQRQFRPQGGANGLHGLQSDVSTRAASW